MPTAAALTEDTRARLELAETAATALTVRTATLEAKVKPATTAAAATTLGTAAKKLEVFTPGGVSLGFVPLYDAIT